MSLLTSHQGHALLTVIGNLVTPRKPGDGKAKSEDAAERLEKAVKEVEGANVDLRMDRLDSGDEGHGQALLLLRLLELVQSWQTRATRGGRAPAPEDVLNMIERKNVQLAIKVVITDALLPACRAFINTPREARGEETSESASAARVLEDLVDRLLRLTKPSDEDDMGQLQDQADAHQPQPSGSTLSPHQPIHRPTLITSTLASLSILPTILTSTILLAWSQSFPPKVHAGKRKVVIQMMEGMGGAEGFSVLGAALGLVSASARKRPLTSTTNPITTTTYPSHVHLTLKVLLTQLLLKPTGVQDLMTNVFGTEMGKNDVLELHKLEYLTRVLGDVRGVGTKGGQGQGQSRKQGEKDWWQAIGGQLVDIIVPTWNSSGDDRLTDIKGKAKSKIRTLPERYIHAASFVITQLIDQSPNGFGAYILPLIHDTFLPSSPARLSHTDTILAPIVLSSPSRIEKCLSLLLSLLTRVPPSSTLLDRLLTPIIQPLFALHSALAKDPTADLLTREELRDVLRSWGRLSGESEAVEGFMGILRGGRGWGGADEGGNEMFWEKVLGGEEAEEGGEEGFAVVFGRPPETLATRIPKSASSEIRISATSESPIPDIAPSTNDEMDDEGDLPFPEMDLHPDPQGVVDLIVSLQRESVASQVFERCLALYQTRSEDPELAMSALLYLQLVMLLSEKLGDKIFKDRPESTLLFVEQALRPTESTSTRQRSFKHDEEDEDEGDSDDEVDDALDADEILDVEDVSKLNIKETAISLLVAVVSAQNGGTASFPILQVIEQHLVRLERRSTARIRQLAHSATMLLAVFKAGGHADATKQRETRSETMSTYQEALKLLADPLLPVRGHGLIKLQSVVTAADFDRALLPAIMDIFMQAVKDEDSFMYLNAVKGLSSMVDGIGRDVLQSLVSEYARNLDRIPWLQAKELDRRLRLGEALLQCVRRAGQALSRYADVLVPSLLRIFPISRIPTVLRTSALSILATSAEMNRIALLPWLDDLIPACLDLIQVESVAVTSRKTGSEPSTSRTPEPVKGDDSKHPALRRAALVFLGLAFDAQAREQEEQGSSFSSRFDGDLARLSMPTQLSGLVGATSQAGMDVRLYQRAKTILAYVAGTDVDDLARHQAAEALSILGRLSHAL